MKICILGWYGTETLGDRAILDGIIKVFATIDNSLSVRIGSLYTIVTERTIFEDADFYRRHTRSLEISTFDVKDRVSLHTTIREVDLVIMGGGPLMDLIELYIIQHAFKYAKKHGKDTALIGCGYGPLIIKEYIECVRNIIHFSDLVIMRSELCRERVLKICHAADKHKIFASFDPAIISVVDYNKLENEVDKKDGLWLMNIRDLDYVYSKQDYYYPIIKQIVDKVAKHVPELYLIPMHTFYIGGDDRYIQNRIAQDLLKDNIHVRQKPLSLKESYDIVRSADGCFGMRYHSIVLQTFLNGNNYIVDYTDHEKGKIQAFLQVIDSCSFYKDRYINILEQTPQELHFDKKNKRFVYESKVIEKCIKQYKYLIENAISGDVE